MIKKLISRFRRNQNIESHRFLLFYAHIIALIHGFGFLFQWDKTEDHFLKYALSKQDAWHNGLPAVSVFSSYLFAATITIVLTSVSLYVLYKHFNKKIHWIFILLVFLSGGGFVYFFISTMTLISINFIKLKHHKNYFKIGEVLICCLLIWLGASWILGCIFPKTMFELSLGLFFIWDIMIPFVILWIYRSLEKPKI